MEELLSEKLLSEEFRIEEPLPEDPSVDSDSIIEISSKDLDDWLIYTIKAYFFVR